MFKDLDAPYLCGEQSRRSQRWVKVKGDHIAGISETMDCLILAAYYGEGSVRRGAQPPHRQPLPRPDTVPAAAISSGNATLCACAAPLRRGVALPPRPGRPPAGRQREQAQEMAHVLVRARAVRSGRRASGQRHPLSPPPPPSPQQGGVGLYAGAACLHSPPPRAVHAILRAQQSAAALGALAAGQDQRHSRRVDPAGALAHPRDQGRGACDHRPVHCRLLRALSSCARGARGQGAWRGGGRGNPLSPAHAPPPPRTGTSR